MKTPAIVLRSFVQGESDVILWLMTRELGKVRAVAKGGMRSQKRFMGQLMLFQHLEVNLVQSKKSGLPMIEESRILQAFSGIREDIRRVGEGSVLLEIVELAAVEGEKQVRVYELLASGLARINAGKSITRARLFYQIKLLECLGFRPVMEHCACCGREVPEGPVVFSAEMGGVLCRDCEVRAGRKIGISQATRKTVARALKLEREKLDRLQFTKLAIEETKVILDEFTTYHLERNLSSVQFLKKLEMS